MHDKKKPAMTLVISVGPKMPKKPTDTATPDKMKKYGSMKKGAPAPDWAQQNNSNRSNFKGTEDYQQQTGGDAYASTYGGKPVGIQRMPSGDPRDMARVKDLASGTYGGQEYGGQEPGYYTGNPNLTNEKLNAFMAAEEAKKKPQPQPQPQPTTAPPVGQAFNTQQQQQPQQPQQVQTGEPMDLAFRLLKEVPMYNYGGSPIPERIPEWLKTSRRLRAKREEKTGVLPLWERLTIEEEREKQQNGLAEMRAARDAARAQMGQQNPNRGGDVDPI